ncbi:MAG: hypothetical protein KAU20_01100, partial [Nanoarchaeota archaeon]|nr:hypothetical protein [Nanoarchaeota archaeon]
MSYTDKLKKFNDSEKYLQELEFLRGLISTYSPQNTILDYGCGNGFAVNHLHDCGLNFIGGHDVKH